MLWSYVKSNLNFYRIHLFFFVITPIILSAIAYASNGEFKLHYIDLLFVFVSGATGTGLTTIDLSSTTPWQQVLLVIIEIIGNQASTHEASPCLIFRPFLRRYFLSHLKYIVAAENEKRPAHAHSLHTALSLQTIRDAMLHRQEPDENPISPWCGAAARPKRGPPRISSDMVRRVDVEPQRINPMGGPSRTASCDGHSSAVPHPAAAQRLSHSDARATSVPRAGSPGPLARGDDDNGGFPSVPQMVARTLRTVFPRLHRRLRKTVTMPRTETLVPRAGRAGTQQPAPSGSVKAVSYLPFRANVGRNSTFRGLTTEQAEELGGLEYRALNALLWIVPLYYFGLLAISFVVIAPYMILPRWHYNFVIPQQHHNINSIWFSAFQVVGAWANTGMSLVDQNMVPFRTAYPMIIFLVVCVLAGNSLFPVFLRFLIWVLIKLSPKESRREQTLAFLLDHPRRCFIYLFPSGQTWLLLSIQLSIDMTIFVFTLTLNLGNPATDAIPVGVRVINAVLAAAAVRSSGFQSISVSTLVPAIQILYLVLMYINIYPIALSVRSTNVWEDKALGIYEEEEESEDVNEIEKQWKSGPQVTIWGKNLLRHARKQLSYDMWWLALSLFLLCIIERDSLMNTDNASWLNIFSLIFEVVSAYGTVGLSLGTPYANYCLSGALHTLSKLIICAVMIRGRHRSLPVALDRAVLLPRELQRQENDPAPPNLAPPEILLLPAEERHNMGTGRAVTIAGRSRTLSFVGDEKKETGLVSAIGQIPVLEDRSKEIGFCSA
ncbi:TrkH-domain-containing protein [Wolfiporia cocos MD-104 SS10]|uniref:TrkH-domain-containing protein n=1 Tax=Wolfiporia cocos (strain MD-104) TaxID=742152 RepID=A0A2H3JES6_WOLCO|nr:TrkH-domain-containing protein [Wolfiporia cocos MD-104 SS10]